MSKTHPKDQSAAQVEPVNPAAVPDVAAQVEEATVRGRALVDLPAFGVVCGDFCDLPASAAASLAAVGQFDDQAAEE